MLHILEHSPRRLKRVFLSFFALTRFQGDFPDGERARTNWPNFVEITFTGLWTVPGFGHTCYFCCCCCYRVPRFANKQPNECPRGCLEYGEGWNWARGVRFLGVAPWTVDTLVHAARAYGLPKHRGDEPETRIYKTNTLSHDGW